MNANRIFFDPPKIHQTTANIKQIEAKLTVLAMEANALPFGKKPSHLSTGPCADEMDRLSTAFHDTLLQMCSTITSFVDYIVQGSENMEEMDKYLATLSGSIERPELPEGED